MSSSHIVPCIWFDDQAEQAAAFYVQTFPDSRITAISRYPESSDNPSGRPRGSVLTVEFEVAGQRFAALNGGPHFVVNPSISFFVHVDTTEDAERLFSVLADGGEALMPLDAYPWSERYAAGEGPPGAVKHGGFVLASQEMVAMDSHVDHGVTFNEALSLQVMCKDQDELDRYWAALAEGGEKGPCGWLKDRFGLSWQVVPTDIAEWMTSKDVAARDRAFEAMLQMKRLDIAALKRAFDGDP
jgi:predicted 3-demethylubiquinone-9 3-methyltransferase (glyoxalase superfamily)